jgi:hypothetical protein
MYNASVGVCAPAARGKKRRKVRYDLFFMIRQALKAGWAGHVIL